MNHQVQVRQAVFETNSSSSHSLTMDGDVSLDAVTYYGISPTDFVSGTFPVSMKSYGIDDEELATVSERLAYVLLQALIPAFNSFQLDQSVHLTVVADKLTAKAVPNNVASETEVYVGASELNETLATMYVKNEKAYHAIKRIVHYLEYETGLSLVISVSDCAAEMDYQVQHRALSNPDAWFDIVFNGSSRIVIQDNMSDWDIND